MIKFKIIISFTMYYILNLNDENKKTIFVDGQILDKLIILVKNVRWIDELEKDKYGNIVVVGRIPYLPDNNTFQHPLASNKIAPTFEMLNDIDCLAYQIEQNNFNFEETNDRYDSEFDYDSDDELYY